MDLIFWVRAQWDRVLAVASAALGGVLLVLGWRGVADAALTAQQVPYVVSGGLGGLFLLAVGATLWISADLRDEWRKLDALHDDVKDLRAELQQHAPRHEPPQPSLPGVDADLLALVEASGLPSSNGSGRKRRVTPVR